MATKEGKRRGKEEKKSAKKVEEPPPVVDEKKEDSSNDEARPCTDNRLEAESQHEQVKAPTKTPEPVYEEPLSKLIIERYEGDKVRGLYEGDGVAHFIGGHMYKGQFSEGLMSGKGIYTWADGMVYEGDFLRNKITGEGMYRWPDGSVYEGDVLNGKRHGCGTFRFANNSKSYSGEWKYGKRHGKGRMDYDSDGQSYYDGDWVSNCRHGTGIRQYATGNIYQGQWFNNVRHGEGTMKWLDRDQLYMGTWENGIQHGQGRHIWLLRRKMGSQYPVRNMYHGDFVNGLRHGYGCFYYANGAKYEGQWKNNMKHGEGKFTFKNGRIFEGRFEKDHIVDFPEFVMDGTTSPDLSLIRTKTPLPTDNMSVHSNDSVNTFSPNFQLEIDSLIAELPEADRDEEVMQVMNVIMRFITQLRKIYTFYSSLGHSQDESPDNTFFMTKMQFWRFLKDCKVHHLGHTLMDMDRYIAKCYGFSKFDIHQPFRRLLQRQFVNYIIILAHFVYNEMHREKGIKEPVLAWCLRKLITENILPHACTIKGHFLFETRRAVNANVHVDQAYNVYQSVCKPRIKTPHEQALKMRGFMFMMNDLKLINEDLNPQAIIQVLSEDDPAVADNDGSYNLELEMTFLEFFEGLIGCAEHFVTEAVVHDPSTPRPSTCLTAEQSMYSIPSPSRNTSRTTERATASKGIEGDAESGTRGSPQQGSGSSDSPQPGGASSVAGTTKTGGDTSSRTVEGQAVSTMNMAGGEMGNASGVGSARGDVLNEQRKSASYLSTHTPGTEDPNLPPGSVAGQTEPGHEDLDGELEGGESLLEPAEEVILDEATRQFNFWTHQIHIFFVRKFFPAFEKQQQIRERIERRRLEQAREAALKKATMVTLETPHSPSQNEAQLPQQPQDSQSQLQQLQHAQQQQQQGPHAVEQQA